MNAIQHMCAVLTGDNKPFKKAQRTLDKRCQVYKRRHTSDYDLIDNLAWETFVRSTKQ